MWTEGCSTVCWFDDWYGVQGAILLPCSVWGCLRSVSFAEKRAGAGWADVWRLIGGKGSASQGKLKSDSRELEFHKGWNSWKPRWQLPASCCCYIPFSFLLTDMMILRNLSALMNMCTTLSGRSIAFLSFILFYTCALQYCRLNYYRDPTSFFFNPQRAYTESYSAVRRQQADSFIQSASKSDFNKITASSEPTFCVGVASVARDSARYFSTSVGSLLEGLTTEERKAIYLVLFIAHTDPQTHPEYAEPWVENVADRVLTYALPEDQLEYIRKLENDRGIFREKALFDYTYLLKACAAVEARYILMVEDDVIALDGWYHRTRDALKLAETQSHLKGSPNCKDQAAFGAHPWTTHAYIFSVLYLRLFYTEEFLGWNSEEWSTYVLWSFIVFSASALSLIGLRDFHLPLRKFISFSTIIVACGVCVPLCILLFFAAGRVSMLPLPAGVNEMPRFGCCSQSWVFPHSRAADVISWYESKKVGFVDMLTEELADRDGELRWALTPSVMQHVGRKSSKGDDFGKDSKYHMSVAEKLWNFAFERNDPRRLREEHLRRAGGW